MEVKNPNKKKEIKAPDTSTSVPNEKKITVPESAPPARPMQEKISTQVELNSAKTETKSPEIKSSIPSPDAGISSNRMSSIPEPSKHETSYAPQGLSQTQKTAQTTHTPTLDAHNSEPSHRETSLETARREALERQNAEKRSLMGSTARQLDKEAQQADLKAREDWYNQKEGIQADNGPYSNESMSGDEFIKNIGLGGESDGIKFSSNNSSSTVNSGFKFTTDSRPSVNISTPDGVRNIPSSPSGGSGDGPDGPYVPPNMNDGFNGGGGNGGGPGGPNDPGGGGPPPGPPPDDLRASLDAVEVNRLNYAKSDSFKNKFPQQGSGSKGVADYFAREMMWTALGDSTLVGQGVRFTADNFVPLAKGTKNIITKQLANANLASLPFDKGFSSEYSKVMELYKGMTFQVGNDKEPAIHITNINKINSSHDTRQVIKDLQRILKVEGIDGFEDKNGIPISGAEFSNKCAQQLKIFKKKSTSLEKEIKNVKGALAKATGTQAILLQKKLNSLTAQQNKVNRLMSIFKVGNKVGAAEAMQDAAGKKPSQLIAFLRKKLYKYGRQDMTINAMLMTGTMTRHVRAAIKNSLKAVKSVAMIGVISSKLSYIAAKKAGNLALKSSLGQLLSQKEGFRKVASAAKKGKQATKNAVKSVRKYSPKNILKRARARILERFKRTKVGRFFTSVSNLRKKAKTLLFKGKYNPLRILVKPFNFLSRIFNIVGRALNTVKTYLLLGGLLLLIVTFGVSAFFSIFSVFDVQNQEHTSIAVMMDTVEEVWSEEMQYISSIGMGDLNNLELERSEEADSMEERHQTNERYLDEFDYKESSNFTELISMAYVRSEFDLDDPQKLADAKQYFKEMYYGSHTFTLESQQDGDYNYGKVRIDTMYFDELFDCQPAQSFNPVGPMLDGTGQLVQTKVKVKSVGKFTCSCYGPYDPGDNGATASGEDPIPLKTVATMGTGESISSLKGIYRKWGEKIVLDMPENGLGIQGYMMWTVQDHGPAYGMDHGYPRVFDFRFQEAQDGFGMAYGKEIFHVTDSGDKELTVWAYDDGTIVPLPGSVNPGTTGAQQFAALIAKYDAWANQYHSRLNKANGSISTFDRADKEVKKGHDVDVNCTTPTRWALTEMNIIDCGITFKSGHLSVGDSTKEKLKQYLQFCTKKSDCPAIGETVSAAVKNGHLQNGDIIGIDLGSTPHLFSYVNGKMAEMGGEAKGKKGNYFRTILLNPNNYYKSKEIVTILRWKK